MVDLIHNVFPQRGADPNESGVSPRERMTPEVYEGWKKHMSETRLRINLNKMLQGWT